MPIRVIKTVIALVILAETLLSGALMAQSKTFYVSTAGNDLNDGLSIALPFSSIARGISAASAGDTIYLLPGTYREIVKILQRTGIAERPLCIYGYGQTPESRPTIDGGAVVPSNTNYTNYWMDIENSDWIEIGNIEFRNGWTNPIKVVNSSYLTFNGCYFYGGKKVIAATGSNTHHVLVQNCFWDQGGDYLWRLVTDQAGIDAWTSIHEGLLQYYNGSLIEWSGTGGSIVIRNNTIVNAFNGIRWSARNDYDSNIEIYDNTVTNIRDNDFEPENYTFNLHIYHNLSHNIHKTMSVDHVQGGSIYYYGNRITSDIDYWSNQVCTSFWKIYGAGTDNLTSPMYIFNNSFCGVGKIFSMDAGTVAVQVKHFNNAYYIIGSRGWVLSSVDSTDMFDFDISNKPWPSGISGRNQEQNGLVADIQFASTASADLRLKPTSPGIDKGIRMSIPELGWTQSFQGLAPDIGAYEGEGLLEGPPFRFRQLPGMSLLYVEKPRIVRTQLTGNTLSLSFSEAINPASVSSSSIFLSQNGATIKVIGVFLSDEGYKLDIAIETTPGIDDHSLALTFNPLPKGINGESVTMWAAALAGYKKSIVTSVSGSKPSPKTGTKLDLVVYPNPLRSPSHISIRIPASLAGEETAVYQLYDVIGRKLEEGTFSPLHHGLEFSFSTARLAAGTYFSVVRVGQQTIMKKFVVLN